MFQWMILLSVSQSSYRAWNESLLKDYNINWDIYNIWLYKIIFQRLWERIPLVMDDNEKDFKNGEHLFEWLYCCKWLHFSLNWKIFWITHVLVSLLSWGVVTNPQTSKIESFTKIVFSNRSLLLQSAPSYMFSGVLATPLFLILLISFEELNTLVFWSLWDIWKSNLFFPWLRTFLQKRHSTKQGCYEQCCHFLDLA